MYGERADPDRPHPFAPAGFCAGRLRCGPHAEAVAAPDADPAADADHARMHATPTPATAPREICHRSNDGIEVTLWWLPGADRLQVAVVDTKLNQCFQLPVDAVRAMRVFNHPYLYAEAAGIRAPYGTPELSPAWTVAP